MVSLLVLRDLLARVDMLFVTGYPVRTTKSCAKWQNFGSGLSGAGELENENRQTESFGGI